MFAFTGVEDVLIVVIVGGLALRFWRRRNRRR
jgi:hypothetical protein